ncbi:unnamed protein product, partial [Prunus brigantina]
RERIKLFQDQAITCDGGEIVVVGGSSKCGSSGRVEEDCLIQLRGGRGSHENVWLRTSSGPAVGLSREAERKNEGWSHDGSHGATKVLGRDIGGGKRLLARSHRVVRSWRLGSVMDWIITMILLLVLMLLARVIRKALVERKKK